MTCTQLTVVALPYKGYEAVSAVQLILPGAKAAAWAVTGITKGRAVRNMDSVTHSRNTSTLGALYARIMVPSLLQPTEYTSQVWLRFCHCMQ